MILYKILTILQGKRSQLKAKLLTQLKLYTLSISIEWIYRYL